MSTTTSSAETPQEEQTEVIPNLQDPTKPTVRDTIQVARKQATDSSKNVTSRSPSVPISKKQATSINPEENRPDLGNIVIEIPTMFSSSGEASRRNQVSTKSAPKRNSKPKRDSSSTERRLKAPTCKMVTMADLAAKRKAEKEAKRQGITLPKPPTLNELKNGVPIGGKSRKSCTNTNSKDSRRAQPSGTSLKQPQTPNPKPQPNQPRERIKTLQL